jgi:Capsule assembly protein Wzi
MLLQICQSIQAGRQHAKSLAGSSRILALTTAALLFTTPLFCRSKSDAYRDARGPIYVPLDSWVYPALERLASMGFAPDEESLAKPWTRGQCSMLVDEVADMMSRRSARHSAAAVTTEAARLVGALQAEFVANDESYRTARIESLYSTYLQVAGTPLRDSYHFGQTFMNDFGRPYGGGVNAVAGFAGYGILGRFSAYFRGEYQDAGGRAPYDQQIQTVLATADGVPFQPSSGLKATRRFEPIEAYLGVRLGAFDVTLGKQALWWGPGESSALHFSNNADPFFSARISQAEPIVLPGPFRLLGRIRTQFLIGQLAGHQYPPHPFLNAQKITFQLTPDLEVGFTRSAIFGGTGHPLTAGNIFNSFFSSSSMGSTSFGAASDPGDRRSGFDFRWRIPFLRRYLAIYSDSLADDEPSPLASPHRSVWGPGLYVTQFPGLRRLDFRFETYSTWLYERDAGGNFIYWNNQYRDAYTNDGNLLGSWVGRDARAYTANSTYWFSAQAKISASFRQTKTGSNFLPGGGTQTDISLTVHRALRPDLLGMVSVQYERYFVPLAGNARKDLTAQFQLVLYPKKWAVAR